MTKQSNYPHKTPSPFTGKCFLLFTLSSLAYKLHHFPLHPLLLNHDPFQFPFLHLSFSFSSSYNTKVMAYSGGRPNIYIYLYIFFLSWAPPLYEKSVFLSWGAIAINCVFKRPDIDNDSLPRLPMFLQARRFLVSFFLYISSPLGEGRFITEEFFFL